MAENNIPDFLKELNPEQYKAATTLDGPLIILAGAGSGKTKTLIARTANILRQPKTKKVLVVTFTNKAAKEMKERAIKIISNSGGDINRVTLATFHSWCMQFLKHYIPALPDFELKSGFQMAQESEQRVVIKDLMKKIYRDVNDPMFVSLNESITPKHWSALSTWLQTNRVSYTQKSFVSNEIRNLIRVQSKSGRTLSFFDSANIDYTDRDQIDALASLYCEYKKALRASNLADFDDLINLSVTILKENNNIRNAISNHYGHLMVDEFQDTNTAQIELLDLLVNENNNICVVGDDSQSIYGFRGAKIEYILNFHLKFKKCKKISLSKNYRSAKKIVNAANSLIDHSTQKHEFKDALKAFQSEDGEIVVQSNYSTTDEGTTTARNIKTLLKKGVKPEEIAILYRTNIQTGSIEAALLKSMIPYSIYKGRSLLQKKIIQEFLSILSLVMSNGNNMALESAMLSNMKIASEKLLSTFKKHADIKGLDLYDLLIRTEEWRNIKLTKLQNAKIETFVTAVKKLKEVIDDCTSQDFLEYFINIMPLNSSYLKIVTESKSDKAVDNASNALADFDVISTVLLSYKTPFEFLEAMALNEELEENQDKGKVQLMTLHASKGLEFECVLFIGVNEGIIPSGQSVGTALGIEEERKLSYVGLTRAKRVLIVSYLKSYWGKQVAPSRFIKEAGLI